MKKFRGIVFLTFVLGIAIWLLSLLRCEILTFIHKDDFKNAYISNNMLGDMEQFHVLSYKNGYARVYYIGKGKSSGDVLTFKKENGKWLEIEWETVWSGCGGSASGVVWPYWWHFVYGGI